MAGVSSGIPVFYVEQFSSNLQLKLQQEGSVLAFATMSGNHVGSQASPVDQFGAINANKVTQRYAPIGRIDAPTDRRWVFPQDYDANQLMDSFDQLRLLIDPVSGMVQNAGYALGRAKDQEILAGILGVNYTGNNGGTQTSLPSTQIVGVNQGAASATNLTVAKLRAARKILMQNYVNFQKEEIYVAVNAANHDSLLAETQVINRDYSDMPVLKEGRIERYLGFNFVHTELLSVGTDDQSGTSTMVPVWVKSGVYTGIWSDITTDISQRKDLTGLPWQAYVKATFGATRLEEKKIVQIWAR